MITIIYLFILRLFSVFSLIIDVEIFCWLKEKNSNERKLVTHKKKELFKFEFNLDFDITVTLILQLWDFASGAYLSVTTSINRRGQSIVIMAK
jgi:hypothetical protein